MKTQRHKSVALKSFRNLQPNQKPILNLSSPFVLFFFFSPPIFFSFQTEFSFLFSFIFFSLLPFAFFLFPLFFSGLLQFCFHKARCDVSSIERHFTTDLNSLTNWTWLRTYKSRLSEAAYRVIYICYFHLYFSYLDFIMLVLLHYNANIKWEEI